MRANKGTIGLVVALALVGVLGVAAVSAALGTPASPRIDGSGLAGVGGHVVWNSEAPGGAVIAAAETTPSIGTLSPTIKAVGSSAFTMTVTGSSFVTTSTVLWNGDALGIVPGTLTASSVNVAVTAARVAVVHPVHVSVRTGSKESSTTATFTITQPTIVTVAPTFTASAVATTTVTLTGTYLKDGLDDPHLALKGMGAISGTTITGISALAASNSTMVGVFNLASPTVAPPGVYDVVLTWGATGSVTKHDAFSINYPLPTVTSISPTPVYAGSMQPLVLTVNGTGFAPASAIRIGTRLTTNTTFVSATRLTVPLAAADIATAGTVPITVFNPLPGGGTSTAVNLTVSSDTTAPVTTIAGADSDWHNTDVVLTVTSTDAASGVQKTVYDVNAGTATLLAGSTITLPADGTLDGVNTVEAWSTDWCGNVEDPGAVATVNIDTVGPKTSGGAPDTVNTGRDSKATFKYRANDVTPKCSFLLKIKYKSTGKVARHYDLGLKGSNKDFKYTVKPNLAAGKYIFYVYATDQAGNQQSKLGTDTFTVK